MLEQTLIWSCATVRYAFKLLALFIPLASSISDTGNMASKELLGIFMNRTLKAENLLRTLQKDLEFLGKVLAYKSEREKEAASQETAALQAQVESLKSQLIAVEISHGIKQIPIAAPTVASTPAAPAAEEKPKAAKAKAAEAPAPAEAPAAEPAKEPKAKKEKKPKPEKGAGDGGEEEKPVDVSRFDMRIGKIVEVEKHPDADALYVEKVDVGEEKPRTIVSGLVKHVPIEEMQGRIAVFLLNLKPAKMRGVMSEGMIMCANTPEKVEILVPPAGAQVGDKISFDGYLGQPDLPFMNPKKKIFETVQPELLVNGEGVATYKGSFFKIEGKGLVTSPTIRLGGIK